MRNWGTIVTGFYILVIALLAPLILKGVVPEVELLDFYTSWGGWIWIAIMMAAPLMLLSVSVDVTRKMMRPRRSLSASIVAIALAFSLLSVCAVWSIAVVIGNDDVLDHFLFNPEYVLLPWLGVLWILWGGVFYRYGERLFDRTSRLYALVVAGSVFELLIAVPSHILMRQRDQCSAPMVTGFGIATGLALMVMSFGPGILFLYHQRMSKG